MNYTFNTAADRAIMHLKRIGDLTSICESHYNAIGQKATSYDDNLIEAVKAANARTEAIGEAFKTVTGESCKKLHEMLGALHLQINAVPSIFINYTDHNDFEKQDITKDMNDLVNNIDNFIQNHEERLSQTWITEPKYLSDLHVA